VDAGVEHGLGPRVEAVVEDVEGFDAGGFGFQQEALADDPVQPLLLASALGLTG